MVSVADVGLRRRGQRVGGGTLEVFADQLCWADSNSATDNLVVSFTSIRSYDIASDNDGAHLAVALDEEVISFHFEREEALWSVFDCLVGGADVSRRSNDELGWRGGEQERQPTGDRSVVVRPLALQTHVTCLRFVGDLLFAGIGPNLRAFAREAASTDWTCVLSRRVFSQQNVYGIADSGSALVVYGGKSLSFLRLIRNREMSRIRVVYSFPVEDWVLDCSWLSGGQRVWLLTANNALLCYELRSPEPVLLSRYLCSERCILYSGKILSASGTRTTVLAGTVFSTILVWSTAGCSNPRQVERQLSGHKGVIFSLNYCEKTRRICSTSDDRTVRVWEVDFLGENVEDWSDCSVTLKFTLYGHSARVWTSQFASEGRIVSVGEDSRVCLWSSEGALDSQWCGHQSGEVWSADVSGALVATGGSDGGINLWPLRSAPAPSPLPMTDQSPRCVGLTRFGDPFLVSSDGSVLLYSDNDWQLCLSDLRFTSYCLHSVSPDRMLLALASIAGSVLICQLGEGAISKLLDFNVCQGRIFTVKWVNNCQLIVCEAQGVLTLWNVFVTSATCEKLSSFELPASKERWATCCASNEKFVVCGDRSGSLFLYSKLNGRPNPVFLANRVHGHDGVTDVKFFGGQLTSTGRDGTCREWIVEDDRLTLLRTHKLSFNWAAAVFAALVPKKMLIGFHEAFFVLWSIDERRAVLKLDCGGGHRSWDCMVHSESDRVVRVVYIKGKLAYFCSVPMGQVLCPSVLVGGHPKAINAAALVPAQPGAEQLLLLGGEDTTLRLISLNNQLQTQLSVVQSHLSSVRAVTCHWSASGNCAFAASGGGRGQFVIWRILNSAQLLEIVELHCYFIMSSSQRTKLHTIETVEEAEMRIMDLAVAQRCNSFLTLYIGCSDGVVRLFSYSIGDNKIDHVQDVENGNCLLKILLVDWTPNNVLLTADTVGSIKFHQLSDVGEIELSDKRSSCYTVSEMGVNSFDCQPVGDHCLVLATGGDDARVCFASFHLTKRWSLTDQLWNESAHHCQISGLKMTDRFVFTASLDQTLSTFSWSVINNCLEVSCLACTQLSIPDIHGSLVWRRDKGSFAVYIYGLGTQLLEVQCL